MVKHDGSHSRLDDYLAHARAVYGVKYDEARKAGIVSSETAWKLLRRDPTRWLMRADRKAAEIFWSLAGQHFQRNR